MGRIPQPLQRHAVGLAERCGQLLMQLERIVGALEDCLAGDLPLIDRDAAERFFPLFGAMLGRAQSLRTLWQDYADERDHDPPRARWIEVRTDEGRRSYDLHGSPITAAELLKEGLWSRAAGVVVTSATLTALGAFDRFTRFAGVPEGAMCERVQSPFAHERAILQIPAMRSQPGDAVAHTGEVLALLPELLREDTGALVLFSSRRQMQDVQSGLSPDLRERVLTQGDCSNQELIARHCAAVDSGTQSIIFGLASFAEGIDLPGHYCSHVVIAKIPFAVPDSPLEAAMAEWIEARGGNAFMEISVPDAALRLVQASGRLLRNEGDSGTITILDRRLLQRPYGRAILDSLPPFARRFA
jgi:ATP-dependent DNA helicase DinG